MDLAAELQRIYDSEINAEINWSWDGGFTVRLGDKVNGFLAEEDVNSVADVLPWLQEPSLASIPIRTTRNRLEPAVKARAERKIAKSVNGLRELNGIAPLCSGRLTAVAATLKKGDHGPDPRTTPHSRVRHGRSYENRHGDPGRVHLETRPEP
jgi:hypothetical protein